VALTKLGLYEQILDDATQTAVADLNQEDFKSYGDNWMRAIVIAIWFSTWRVK
jgi:hypothetical protein